MTNSKRKEAICSMSLARIDVQRSLAKKFRNGGINSVGDRGTK
jgi:hypothetical protein